MTGMGDHPAEPAPAPDDRHAGSGRDRVVAALTDVWKTERPRIVAAIARRTGDLQAAEDAVQEAFAAASTNWVQDGVPNRPGAWLTTTAWRKAVDEQRRHRFPLAAATPSDFDAQAADPRHAPADAIPSVTEDDLLALMMVCCHPALPPEAQVALTLRHVAGLRDDRIAALLLVTPATVTKRLVRARAKIRDAGIPFGVPDAQRLHQRLEQLRTVIYLIFTEGYLPAGREGSGADDLCAEAVWLALQLHELLPDDDETTGLAALLLLQHARAGARQDGGEIVAFAAQDRGKWDCAALDRAKALLATTTGTPPGPYRIEAAIALLHAVAPSVEAIDWPQIARLYDILLRLDPTPVVAVNHAMAHGRAAGPGCGLALLDPLLNDPRLAGYLPMWAAHAELLERCRDPGAAAAWRRAAAMADSEPQRRQLLQRAEAATRPVGVRPAR
jgi:RNA polymerase sigma-70 factor (ECF subfamily)